MATHENRPELSGTSAVPRLVLPEKLIPKTQTAPLVGAGIAIFSDWKIFTGNGTMILDYQNNDMNVNCNVMVSASEMTPNDSPFIGDAGMWVGNVAPYNNGCKVMIAIPFTVSIRFQLMFLWAKPV